MFHYIKDIAIVMSKHYVMKKNLSFETIGKPQTRVLLPPEVKTLE